MAVAPQALPPRQLEQIAVGQPLSDRPAFDLPARLEAWHAHFGPRWDPRASMLASDWLDPGYHTAIPAGAPVHGTRETLWYAQALLERGEPADVDRAAVAIRAVLALQDTNPRHETYGTWPWFAEEPLATMDPPDPNWADFLGASLAEMLVRHSDRLDADLLAAMRASLGHAAAAIRRRDVGAGYTNIAIMGGVVTAVAGELLADRSMLAYGRARLESVVEQAELDGNFTEYNSPTYTLIALEESERGLRLVRDPAARRAAEALRQIAWRTIAQSFHPPTQQWAGPHSRATSDLLADATIQALDDRVGFPPATDGSPGASPPVPILPGPEEWRERFLRLPEDQFELRQPLMRDSDGGTLLESVTWFSREATLGSVNSGDTWTQRHPVIAYWVAPSAPAVFRVRLLKDGRDFASGHLTTDQAGLRALIVLGTEQNRGDWHPSLDRPQDGLFRIRDLRLRFEVTHPDAHFERTDDGQGYRIGAGSNGVTIRLSDGSFDGLPVRVEVGGGDGGAWVDAVLYSDRPRRFRFGDTIDVRLAAAIDLGQSTMEEVLVSASERGTVTARWGSLAVTAPMNVP